MPLKNTQFDSIMREYDRRQSKNRYEQDQRIEQINQELPEIARINELMGTLSAAKARALLQGETDDLMDLKEEIAKLSKKKQTLLTSAGYPADYLDPQYRCNICRDTGYVNGEKCSCFKQAAIELLYNQSNIQRVLEKENFKVFSFDYYSDKIKDESTGKTPRDHARFAVNKAMDLIDHFQTQGGNLFLYGDTGVGKTFLSHCIAWEILQRGFSVLYFSAYELFSILAEQTFSNDHKASGFTMDSICDADLLIIDDLGTELTNSFTRSQLFSIVNERLLRDKSTIISTNYDIESFSNTYTTRVFSRIMENYTLLNLIGKDIRVQKTLGGDKHETE